MKLQRSTGILLGVAIALAATVTIIETRKGTQSSDSKTLYGFTESDVSSFAINLDGSRLAFAKSDDDTWQMTEPESAPADPSAIAFLLNIITSDTVKETVTVNPNQLDTYGLDDPTAIVDLIVNEENHTLTVGDEDFSETSLYVMTEPAVAAADSVDIYLIPSRLESGLERPQDEWLLADAEEDAAAEPDDATADEPQDADNPAQSE